MRLVEVTVRNYRVHREVSVRFDEALTVITGPNETGKSTLAEAIHRGLFLSSRAAGQILDSMRSHGGGVPEVELVFERAGARVHLVKHFAGLKGTTTLTVDGGVPKSGPEAEEALSELLGGKEPIKGGGAENKLRGAWPHLWVWQGDSGRDPFVDPGDFEWKLQLALQKKSGAGSLVESPLEKRLWRILDDEYDARFDQRGRAKKHSPLARAEAELEAARARLEEARRAYDEHADRALELEQRESELASLSLLLERVEAERKDALARADEIAAIEGELERPRERMRELEKEAESLAAAHAELDRMRREATALDEALGRVAESADRAREAEREAHRALGERARALEEASDREREARRRSELAAAFVEHEKAERLLEGASERKRSVDEWRESLERLRFEHDAIAITEEAVSELERLRDEANKASAKVEALAARVELVANDEGMEIALDGEALSPGEARVVFDEAELTLGDATRLRISPGASEDLSSARRASGAAREALERACERLGVGDVGAARRLLGEKERKARDIARAEEAREAKDALAIAARVEEARGEVARCARRIETLLAGAPAPERGPEEWKAEREEAEALHAEAAERLSAAVSERDARRGAHEAAQSAHLEARARQEQAARDRQALREKEDALRVRFGGGLEHVEARARDVEAERRELEASVAAREQRLEALDPELTRETIARLDEAIARDRGKAGVLREGIRQLEAYLKVRAEGAVDPATLLDEAEQDLERSERDHARAALEAEARKHLAELVSIERRTLGERIAEPLLEAVSRYLRVLFGAEAEVGLRWLERGFDTLHGAEVRRPAVGLGASEFSALSHGAREQVAVAVRLALVETLAGEDDGVLPLVLDDAFTHSDPERVKQLRAMLTRAAKSGKIQLVVLSCQAGDYAGLAGEAIELHRARWEAPASDPQVSAETPAEGGPVAPEPVPLMGDEVELLSALEALGGRAGNQRLRERLGWDEARYAEVRDGLVADGRLVPGRGRGGSVRVA